jgi:flagellar assembly protein FliH
MQSMQSKILRGEAALAAEPVPWRRAGPGAAGSPAPALGGDPRESAALKTRVAELEREIERREQAALRKGLDQGRAAAAQEAAAQLKPLLERFAATINELSSHRRQLRRDAETDVVKLAIAIGRRVLRRELATDPDAMRGLVKAALEKLEGREIERVRVNPADAAAVKQHLEQARMAAKFEVVPEPRLERGAAIFETSRGNLDASIETQLDEIQRGLIDRIRG